MKQYYALADIYQSTTLQVQYKRQALEAFCEAIKMFDDQISMFEANRSEAQPHEIAE